MQQVANPVPLARRLPFTGRRATFVAALFHVGRMADRWVQPPGEDVSDTTNVLSLIVGRGYGKTTTLMHIVPELTRLLANEPEFAWDVIKRASSVHAPEIMDRLENSFAEGQQLVSWIRLDADAQLAELEEGLSMENILALRVLYGGHCNTDAGYDMGGPLSAVGSYSHFLQGLDPEDRQSLKPAAAFDSLERRVNHPGGPRVYTVLINDLDSVLPKAAEGDASWGQHMLSGLVKHQEQTRGHDRLILTVFGTTKPSDANFSATTTPNAVTALLPLGYPMWNDQQEMLSQFLQQLDLTQEEIEQGLRNTDAIEDLDSPISQMVFKTGGNFLLLDWMLSCLGGAPILDTAEEWWMGWVPGRLARWLTRGRDSRLTAEERTTAGTLFVGLSQKMLHNGWLRRIMGPEQLLGEDSAQARTKIAQQVAAHTMVGQCVRLMDKVRGVPGVTWQTLYEEGIFNPLFAGNEGDDDANHLGPPMPPVHSEVCVPTMNGRFCLCPPTRNPATAWCMVEASPLALDMLTLDLDPSPGLLG